MVSREVGVARGERVVPQGGIFFQLKTISCCQTVQGQLEVDFPPLPPPLSFPGIVRRSGLWG